MARALNKNKKPESKIKIEHATTFLGSFGSPCSFRDSQPHPRFLCRSELAREAPEDVVGYLAVPVIVHDHREQSSIDRLLLQCPTPSPD
ncbi:hypothetical protein PS928_04156 [Pseudomonas fluorescens]|jgi:hypothetical protein|uniref:Uncharacterized protein n=1 Tax=Pseudomonas fluorescens TaxID=294 RepID=A0A5E7V4H6_PSEFL|nr:hypothetical protein ELQ88_06500 [Pseudomonas sp. MPC6]VVQ14594.1 hypothetical protein PS928_04156 [Pseudomonas fluorescens]